MRFRLDVPARLRVARLLVAAQFMLLGALFLLSILNVHKKVHSYLAPELILAFVGVLLIIVASKNLKPSLKISPIPKQDAPLISIGIYKYVRHPMYLAVILIGFRLLLSLNKMSSIPLKLEEHVLSILPELLFNEFLDNPKELFLNIQKLGINVLKDLNLDNQEGVDVILKKHKISKDSIMFVFRQ